MPISRISLNQSFVPFQRGEMAAFSVLSKEEIDQELSPEEVEEQENCNSQQINEVASPFANLLKNFLGGGGRERKARIQGT